MESSSTPGAGWFADPAGSGGQRWWSGASWTEHVRQEATAAPAASVGTMLAERPPQHRLQAPEPAAPFTLSVPAASNVVGFTSQVDPAIASRYRTQRAEEPVEELALAVPASPSQTGWQGKSLSDAGYLSVAGFGSGTGTTASTAQAAMLYGAQPTGSARLAGWAFAGSMIGLALTVAGILTDRVGWGMVFAIMAIIQGGIALSRSRRTGRGRGLSIAAIVIGSVVFVVQAALVALVVLVLLALL